MLHSLLFTVAVFIAVVSAHANDAPPNAVIESSVINYQDSGNNNNQGQSILGSDHMAGMRDDMDRMRDDMADMRDRIAGMNSDHMDDMRDHMAGMRDDMADMRDDMADMRNRMAGMTD